MEGKDMTRDDITRMAQEVGFVAYGEDAGEYRIPTPAFHNRLERFAKLIRNDYSTKHAQLWLKRIDEAVAAEREACAKAVLAVANDDAGNPYKQALRIGAETIRARGQE
jgi:hypothetical protein